MQLCNASINSLTWVTIFVFWWCFQMINLKKNCQELFAKSNLSQVWQHVLTVTWSMQKPSNSSFCSVHKTGQLVSHGATPRSRVNPKLHTVSLYLWEQKYSEIKEKTGRIFFLSMSNFEKESPQHFLFTPAFFVFVFWWFGLVYELCETWKKDQISSDTSTSRGGKIGDSVLTIS